MKLPTEDVIRNHQERLYATAFSICRNAADAEDVVQDTIVKYHQAKKSFESEEHIRAWLLRVCINLSKNIVSSFWNRNRRSWEDFAETLCFTEETDKRLFETVMGLPEKYRIVIHLFYYEGYSVQEISKLLHRREGTVKSHLSRGRKILKLELQEDWSDDE
ncbi:MAG: RNA polymerase sigma factor [Lachnospiraceae bacterium]|nr:RNA polymerase sigma factor [Lachnospiraceae bacterium]